uniref:Claudin n=1 Tax=Tetraodon nigroviridis TaxID=99883 RepID=H3CER9_TETNG
MALMCRQIIGSGASSAGWVGLIVATATNDWVRTCYSLAACLRMDELVSKGLWAECIVSPSLYHCGAREQILSLPAAYVQTSRALMVCACLLGLPAVLLVLMSMPCIRLQNDSSAIRQRSRVGGVLFLCMALCGIISTVWFPVGAHSDGGLMFGFSLYAGWVGAALCLLGGVIILFCHFLSPGGPSRENSFYFSRQASRAGPLGPLEPPANHAKSARV